MEGLRGRRRNHRPESRFCERLARILPAQHQQSFAIRAMTARLIDW